MSRGDNSPSTSSLITCHNNMGGWRQHITVGRLLLNFQTDVEAVPSAVNSLEWSEHPPQSEWAGFGASSFLAKLGSINKSPESGAWAHTWLWHSLSLSLSHPHPPCFSPTLGSISTSALCGSCSFLGSCGHTVRSTLRSQVPGNSPSYICHSWLCAGLSLEISSYFGSFWEAARVRLTYSVPSSHLSSWHNTGT